MKKRIAAGMMALAFVIFPFCAGLIVSHSYALMLERERVRALSEEAAIARALSKEIGNRGYRGILEAEQTMQDRYGSESLALSFVYHGTPMSAKALPESLSELLQTEGRATLLLADEQTLYIAHEIRKDLLLLAQSDLSPIYEMTRSLIVWSGIICLMGFGLSACLASAISVVVMKPVKALSKAVEKLETGQYDVSLPAAGRDEIGNLTRAFEKMSEAVREREQCLKQEAQQRQNLLDALAHEMRTPLTALVAGADMLQCARLTDSQKSTLIHTMACEARRLSGMEERLSLITNISHVQLEVKAHSLLTLANEAADIFEGVQVEGKGGTILCEKELIIELIRNLIVNAKRAGSTEPIKVILHDRGFTVKDTGCGMTKEQQQRACDPFFKADTSRARKQGGAGLGLTLCKKIADLHGGVLSIESEIGQGTSVTYTQEFTTL